MESRRKSQPKNIIQVGGIFRKSSMMFLETPFLFVSHQCQRLPADLFSLLRHIGVSSATGANCTRHKEPFPPHQHYPENGPAEWYDLLFNFPVTHVSKFTRKFNLFRRKDQYVCHSPAIPSQYQSRGRWTGKRKEEWMGSVTGSNNFRFDAE